MSFLKLEVGYETVPEHLAGRDVSYLEEASVTFFDTSKELIYTAVSSSKPTSKGKKQRMDSVTHFIPRKYLLWECHFY